MIHNIIGKIDTEFIFSWIVESVLVDWTSLKVENIWSESVTVLTGKKRGARGLCPFSSQWLEKSENRHWDSE